MPNQNQTTDKSIDKKPKPHPSQTPASEAALEPSPAAEFPAFSTMTTAQPDVQAQSAVLQDARIPLLQRQMMAGRMGDVQGNLHSMRVMGISSGTVQESHLQRGSHPFRLVQRKGNEDQDDATRLASEIHQSLDGWSEYERLLNAMRQARQLGMDQVKTKFKEAYQVPLDNYLRQNIEFITPLSEYRIRAFALLSGFNDDDFVTHLALALLSDTPHTEEVFNLFRTPKQFAGRQILEEQYDKAFKYIGNGKGILRTDLERLEDLDEKKCKVMLDRELNSADYLYYDSLGIVGTHTDAVINRIQSEWGKGPTSFAEFEANWNQVVQDYEDGKISLYEAMDGELSGEAWELVRAVLHGHKEAEQLVELDPNRELSEQDQFRLSEVRLGAARESLKAATTGGLTGWGTNDKQVIKAVEEIGKIWDERIEHAKDSNRQKEAQHFESLRDKEMGEIRAFIPSEMDEDTIEYKRVQLLTFGGLTPADEIYLAKEDDDDEKVYNLVRGYWAQEQIDELIRQSNEHRIENNQTVRPSFDIQQAIHSSSSFAKKCLPLLSSRDNSMRGAYALQVILGPGASDSDLKEAYELLTLDGISATLRMDVIAKYVNGIGDIPKIYLNEHVSSKYVSTSESKAESPCNEVIGFLDFLGERFGEQHTVFEFINLLSPTTDPEMLLKRAEAQFEASEGWLHFGRTETVTRNSLERLRFIVENMNVSPHELEAMQAVTQAENLEQLAEMEFYAFQSRLQELRQLKQVVAEYISMAVELAVQAVVTAFTGGGFLPALLAKIASIVAKEIILVDDHDVISLANLQELIDTVAMPPIYNGMGGIPYSELLSSKFMGRWKLARAFLEETIDASTDAAVGLVVTLSFDAKMPSGEELLAKAINTLGSTSGAMVGKGATGQLFEDSFKDQLDIDRLLILVAEKSTSKVISGVTAESVALIQSNTENLSGPEIVERYFLRAFKDGVKGTFSGINSYQKEIYEAQKIKELTMLPDEMDHGE